MTIVVISDDDTDIGSLNAGPVDLLICCGDMHDHALVKAIQHYQPRRTFAVRGNHDADIPFPEGVDDLHLATRVLEGIKFGGFEGSWKYKPRGHHLFEQSEVSKLMGYFPKVDVFIAHNSPAGIHERDSEVHQGFRGFADYLERAKPTLMIHGHQHEDVVTMVGETMVLGVFGERLVRFQKSDSQDA